MSHFFFYLVLSLIYHQYPIRLFILGVIWEILELIFLDCHDIMDLYLNFAGIVLGTLLRKLNK